MGLSWCRERVEQAQNSKSPVDRILVCCSNVIKPKSSYSHSQGKIVNDFVYKGMRGKNLGISPPVPIHAVPPRARQRLQRESGWQTCTLHVPVAEDSSKPPIPPPRKKRKLKINSKEVLNSQLPELHSPSYVIYSENFLNKNVDPVEANETDVLRPLEESYGRDRISGLGKLSGNRGRILKSEFRSNEERERERERRGRSDNERKTEQKIKHVSTVSLPNYNELVKPSRKVSTEAENGDDKSGNQSGGSKQPHRNSSTMSLPGEGSNSILSSLSEATIHRLETYMKKCRSFGALKPQQVLEKLEEFNKTHRSASESSDSWSGLDDWDLGVIEYCDPENTSVPPLTPKSTLPPKAERRPPSPPSAEKASGEKTHPTSEPQRIPFVQRCASVVEGVPIEWFLDPSLRAPAIMPPPAASEPEKFTKTPPPSPQNEADQKNPDGEEHSSLLNILRRYKDEEMGEPEAITFEEIDVKIPPESLNPFLPLSNRSNSLTEEESRVLEEEALRLRSPSVSFENSAHLLEQLHTNREEIEKEILLKPNELIKGLRRESLCEILPEDAFEAYVNKRKPSLMESLNDFLGFQEEKKPDQEDDEKFSEAPEEQAAGKRLQDEREDNGDEKSAPPSAPPLPLDPPPVVINPPPTQENTSGSLLSSQIE